MKLDFSKMNGLVPAIVQDADTLQVLMLGFMNEEALKKTIELGQVTFFSRTKNRLWTKGEESKNYLNVVSMSKDCDDDTILILANPVGDTCHLNRQSCFEDAPKNDIAWLSKLERVIDERKASDPEKSYTAKLFSKGIKRMSQKVGEEAIETALAATAGTDDFENECADLLFHLAVLLRAKNSNFATICKVLEKRHK